MEPQDYTSNSRKNQELAAKTEKKAEKKIEKLDDIVTGEVIERKKGIGFRIKTIFFGGDFRTAAAYVAADVFLPTLRTLLLDILNKGTERWVLGDRYDGRRSSSYGPRTNYQYNNSPLWRRDPRDDRSFLSDQPRLQRQQRRNDRDIILPTRDKAELVLEALNDIVEQYEVASVADLHDLLGLPTTPVENKWGWGYLKNVPIRQVREGYVLDMPPEQEI